MDTTEILNHLGRAVELAKESPLRVGGRSCGVVIVNRSGLTIESATTLSLKGDSPTEPGHRLKALHAEIQGISWAAAMGVPLNNSEAFVSWFPCAPCASALAEAGVKRVHCAMEFAAPSGEYDFTRARAILAERGVKVTEYDGFAG